MSTPVLALAAFARIAAACAPGVAPGTLADIVRAESGFRPLAINVNGPGGGSVFPESKAEAVAKVRDLIARGRDFDAGLGQINVRNWGWLGLTPETVFDPCENVRAEAAVLTALSRYNTGSPSRGFANGYVARVLAGAAAAPPPPPPAAPAPPRRPACAPSWDVWATCRPAAAAPATPDHPADGDEATPAGPVLLRGLAMGTPSE